MGLKDLQIGQKKWACPEGCDVTIKICEHLEAELPDPDTGARTRRYLKEYLQTLDLRDYREIKIEQEVFLDKLEMVGLSVLETELIYDKLIAELSDAYLARKYNLGKGTYGRAKVKQIVEGAVEKIKDNKGMFDFLNQKYNKDL